MNTGIPVAILCLAWAYLVGSILNALFPPQPGGFRDFMLRARLVRTARPEGPPLIPASGVARCRPHGVPIADTGAMHAVRDELLGRNGVRLPDRVRKTVDVVVCDPAVTPVVPGWFRAWEQGRWTP